MPLVSYLPGRTFRLTEMLGIDVLRLKHARPEMNVADIRLMPPAAAAKYRATSDSNPNGPFSLVFTIPTIAEEDI